ncbi:MAG: hypothetical protein H0V88_07020 [Pyrinomonadaceae bacterium]|nr:hypothetical protein [Pyrinomonadaceae bacterium]
MEAEDGAAFGAEVCACPMEEQRMRMNKNNEKAEEFGFEARLVSSIMTLPKRRLRLLSKVPDAFMEGRGVKDMKH